MWNRVADPTSPPLRTIPNNSRSFGEKDFSSPSREKGRERERYHEKTSKNLSQAGVGAGYDARNDAENLLYPFLEGGGQR